METVVSCSPGTIRPRSLYAYDLMNIPTKSSRKRRGSTVHDRKRGTASETKGSGLSWISGKLASNLLQDSSESQCATDSLQANRPKSPQPSREMPLVTVCKTFQSRGDP